MHLLSMKFMTSFTNRLALVGLILTCASQLSAEVMTLTNTQGKSLTADIIAVESDHVKIKREDGQAFSIPLDSLRLADQKRVVQLAQKMAAEEAAKPLAPDAIKVELSRKIFKTTSQKEDIKLTTGATVHGGATITQENWGYSLTLTNHTAKPIQGLHTEYRLFATVDELSVADDKLVLKKKAYTTPIDPIKEMNKITVNTESISTTKTALSGNIYSSKSGRNESGERLYGIWLKIFKGDQLVYELAMPESLRTKQKW